MELWMHQGISLLILFGGTMISGVLPIYILIRWKVLRKRMDAWSHARGNVQPAETEAINVKPNCQEVLRSNLICVARSFAFGVLFAVCFLHLIPENAHSFDELGDNEKAELRKSIEQSHQHRPPWSEIITCCGFLFIYMLDLTMHRLVTLLNTKRNPCVTVDTSVDTHQEDSSPEKHGKWPLIEMTNDEKADTIQVKDRNILNSLAVSALLKEENKQDLATNASSESPTQNSSEELNHKKSSKLGRHYHHLDYHIANKPVQDQLRMAIDLHRCDMPAKKSRLLAKHQCGKKSILFPNDYDDRLLESSPQMSPENSAEKLKTSKRIDYGTVSKNSKSESPLKESLTTTTMRQPRLLSLFNSIMIIGGLSMHAVFEGFAIGVQQDPFVLYQLVGAICIHKLLIAVVLGLNLLCETASMRDSIIGLAVFSSMTPIGLLVGALWLRHLADDNNSVCLPVANALATGTMIYVTFFETRPQVDHHSNVQSVLHLLAAICGFLGILGTLLITH